MANHLTGDYEAVVQVSVRQINGLLATLHQHGAKGSGLKPSFPHSVANLRLGDRPKYLEWEKVHFANWLGGAVQSFRASGAPAVTGAELAAKVPPGVTARFQAALEDIASTWTEAANPGSVRGRAEVQVSTPTISLAPGSVSEVIVSVRIRARFIPDPGFAGLPELIHGEVKVTYRVRPRTIGGKRVLIVEVPTEDSKIVYKDLAGRPADVAELTARVRTAIRKEFRPEEVELPADFQFSAFKEVGGGHVIALPVQLSGADAPPSGPASVTNAFLDADKTDFAIAVSKEYVKAQFAPLLDNLLHFKESFEAELPWYIPWPNPTYHLSVKGADLQFNVDSIDLVIAAKATTRAIGFKNYDSIGITQRLKLVLIGQNVDLQASDSDLTITGITGVGSGEANAKARAKIIAKRNKMLDPPQPPPPPPPAPPPQPVPPPEKALNDQLQDATRHMNGALAKFDPSGSSSASYTALEVNPHGIIVRGAIDTKDHYPPHLEIGYTEDGKSFSALNCWIPGGTIKEFKWTYEEYGTSWQALFADAKDERIYHSFTFEIPKVLQGNPAQKKNVCLTIEGTQVDKDGRIQSVTGTVESGTCEVSFIEPPLVVSPLWEAIYGVHWLPTPAPDGILDEVIAAHINVLAHPRPAGGLTTNALVHFTGARLEKPLVTLGRALDAMRRRNVSLTLVLVMPVGTFRSRRAEVEEALGMPRERRSGPSENPRSREERLSRHLLLTEDYGGAWTRTFDARTTPSPYLMNARGEFVWKQEERLDVEELTAAMDEHCLPAPPPRTLPLRLTVRPGERALDAQFEEGHDLAISRLRGQRVLLNFWQSWSAPCIRELRRLQRLHEAGNAPVILAVNGGEERTVLAETRRQHNLSFTLIPDPGQWIARLYGVQCWPTTVSINPDGIVDRIQFGVAHTHRAEDRGKQAP